jgi:hypothetical protein
MRSPYPAHSGSHTLNPLDGSSIETVLQQIAAHDSEH